VFERLAMYGDSFIYFVSDGSNGFVLFGRFRSYSRTLDLARICFHPNHNLTLVLLTLRRPFVSDFWGQSLKLDLFSGLIFVPDYVSDSVFFQFYSIFLIMFIRKQSFLGFVSHYPDKKVTAVSSKHVCKLQKDMTVMCLSF
jgi:hypothetical protein